MMRKTLLRAEASAHEVNRLGLTIKDALHSFANTHIPYRLPSFIIGRLPLIVADLSLTCQLDIDQRQTLIIGRVPCYGLRRLKESCMGRRNTRFYTRVGSQTIWSSDDGWAVWNLG